MRRVNAIKDVGSETLDLGRSLSLAYARYLKSRGGEAWIFHVVDVCCVTGLKLVGFSLHVRWEGKRGRDLEVADRRVCAMHYMAGEACVDWYSVSY
jgi:hypothetical protein